MGDSFIWNVAPFISGKLYRMCKENRRGINEKSERCTVLQWTRREEGQSVWDVTVTPWSCAHPLYCDNTGWCWLGQQGNTHAHSCFHKPCLAAVPKALQRSRLFRHVKTQREREQFVLSFLSLMPNSLEMYSNDILPTFFTFVIIYSPSCFINRSLLQKLSILCCMCLFVCFYFFWTFLSWSFTNAWKENIHVLFVLSCYNLQVHLNKL